MSYATFLKSIYFLFIVTFTGLSSAQASGTKLRLALLPIPDVLPVYIALEEGLFKELGIEVEPLKVGSPIERDQLMQAARVDGMINEISGAASFNREQVTVKIIAVARAPLGESPLFRVLAAPGSTIAGVQELSGVGIGVSRHTIIEYITSRLLTANGVAAEDIVFQSVPVLPERFQLLLSGQLQAATLPDPLASAAIKAGAIDLINDTRLNKLSASVITFSRETLERKGETVKKFMQGWNRAVEMLNENPDTYRATLLKNIMVPKNIQESFALPPMPKNTLPSKEQWDDVMQWMVDKNLLQKPLAYEESVTADFLSK